MKRYELTIIFDSSLEESVLQAEITKVEKQITDAKGDVKNIDRWGVRRLAYLINNHHQGYYVLFQFESKPGLTTEIERNLRINDNVLRFLTVLWTEAPVVEKPKPAAEEKTDDSAETAKE